MIERRARFEKQRPLLIAGALTLALTALILAAAGTARKSDEAATVVLPANDRMDRPYELSANLDQAWVHRFHMAINRAVGERGVSRTTAGDPFLQPIRGCTFSTDAIVQFRNQRPRDLHISFACRAIAYSAPGSSDIPQSGVIVRHVEPLQEVLQEAFPDMHLRFR
jgi:hypothetical protein